MKFNPENPQFESPAEQIAAKLKDILSSEYSTLGHGTKLENTEAILSEGLFTKHNSLSETAIPLDGNPDPAAQAIVNWDHRQSDCVVIIQIPNPGTEVAGGLDYFNGALEEPNRDHRYEISPKFIRGYFQIKTGVFFENEKYDAAAMPITKKRKQGLPTNLGSTPSPVPAPSDDETEDLVW